MSCGLSAAHCPHGYYRSQGCPDLKCAAREECKMLCAWKGGGPCLRDDCPRRDSTIDRGEK